MFLVGQGWFAANLVEGSGSVLQRARQQRRQPRIDLSHTERVQTLLCQLLAFACWLVCTAGPRNPRLGLLVTPPGFTYNRRWSAAASFGHSSMR